MASKRRQPAPVSLGRMRRTGEVRIVSFASAAATFALVFFAAPTWLTGISRVVAAYDAAALVLLALLWILAMHARSDLTRARAAVEDPGRNLIFAVVVVAGFIGIVSAVSILGFGPHVATKAEGYIDKTLAILAVVGGWFLIHTTFTFRYAHLYYFDADQDRQADRGLKFPGTDTPSDYDFAYFSFVLGMTFQVSDVQVESARLRRLALAHGLISFGYNTAILALVVNIASGLLHS